MIGKYSVYSASNCRGSEGKIQGGSLGRHLGGKQSLKLQVPRDVVPRSLSVDVVFNVDYSRRISLGHSANDW